MCEPQPGNVWGWRGAASGMGKCLKHILETEEQSDIEFAVGHQYGKEKHFRAHKFVLSIRSDVFYTMFYGSMPEPAEKTIKLPDILPQAFAVMLKYLYTDVAEDLSLENVMPTLYCAKKYDIPMLVDICAEYAIKNVDGSTCLAFWKAAKVLDAQNVVSRCTEVVDTHCSELFQSEAFLQINIEDLKFISSRDKLIVKEGKVYRAAERLAENACRLNHLKATAANQRRMLGDVLYSIRFPLMTDGQLADGPLATGLLLGKEVCKIYQYKHGTKKL